MSLLDQNILAAQYQEAHADELIKLSEMLFKYTPIRGVRCGRLFEGGKFLFLSTRNDWAQAYFENTHYAGSSFAASAQAAREDAYLYHYWPQEPGTNKALSLNYEFDIWNGLTIYKRDAHGVRFWTFTSGRDQSDIKNFYINNLLLLESFLNHIEKRIGPLLGPGKEKIAAHFLEKVSLQPSLPSEASKTFKSLQLDSDLRGLEKSSQSR